MCSISLTEIIIYFSLGYALGSIPFGLIIGKIFGLGDIRQKGSGNIGATNMLRLGGKKPALLTLIADGGKGALPVAVAAAICPPLGAWAFLGAVIGHMFPVWLQFKGGKGVATTIGGFLALSPLAGAAVCAVWLTTAVLFRYSSLAALVAVGFAPLLLFLLKTGTSADVLSITVVIAILVFIRHRANISRLLKGEEPKIGKKQA